MIVDLQLQEKNAKLDDNRKAERRKLESEIASLRSAVNLDNVEKTKTANNRRQTIMHLIKHQPQLSPVRNVAAGINLGRRCAPIEEESSMGFEDFEKSPEFVSCDGLGEGVGLIVGCRSSK